MFVACGSITLYALRVQFVKLFQLSDCNSCFLLAMGKCPLSERVSEGFKPALSFHD